MKRLTTAALQKLADDNGLVPDVDNPGGMAYLTVGGVDYEASLHDQAGRAS